MKSPLILVISEKMDDNKKEDRHEDRLIRMGQKAREHLGLANEKVVELWPDTDVQDRINRSRALEIFQAYTGDLKNLKKSNIPEEDYNRVGFVTTNTFRYICRDNRRKQTKDIWLADTVEDTVVGGDPEFILFDQNKLVQYASNIGGFGHSDELGSDGPLAEIRPRPTIEVNDFVDSIQKILREHPNVKLINPYEWVAGCYHYGAQTDKEDSERDWPIGGHIHLGNTAKLDQKISTLGSNYRIATFSCLTKILDEYVAIGAMKLDGKAQAIERRHSGYGGFLDHRTDHGRLEYRTLSGEWMSHPDIAKAVIGTVKAVSHAFLQALDEEDYNQKLVMTPKQQQSKDSHHYFDFRNSSFSCWNEIEIIKAFEAERDSSTMMKILNDGEMVFQKSFFTKLKTLLRKLSTYRKYSEHIDAFLELISLPQGILDKRDRDLKHTWVGNEELILS